MVLQQITPRFPVVVKIGHAHAGNGTVSSRSVTGGLNGLNLPVD